MISMNASPCHGRVAILLAWLPCALWAQPSTYRIDAARTQAEFEVEHLGVFHAHGRFGSVAGTLVYDPSALSGAIDLAIPVAAVATGWDSRDHFLRGATMFDAGRFPRIRFVSRKFEFEGGRVVRVEGDLTLRDITKPVTLVVRTLQCERDACFAEASGSIRRREFAMDNWWPLIGDDVQLWFRLAAVRE
jgi:polyisoprenoid-binding protein YceI